MNLASRRVLPGFGLGLSTTLLYLTLLVLLPLGAAVAKAMELSWAELTAAISSERAIAAYRLTFWASFIAAAINVGVGVVVAWTLVRYEFPGKRVVDALVDVPFALPTAVAGLIYASLYVKDGWLGQFLVPIGFEAAYSRTGIVLVLVFTGFPFVVRTVQPVLEDLDKEAEEAAETLGATRWQIFRHIIVPILIPPVLTGFTLAFARAIGEYGSVIFISSNMPFTTEIAPVLIISRLEEFAYREAAAIALALLSVSFLLLVVINVLERWSQPGSAPRLVQLGVRTMLQVFMLPLTWLTRRWSPRVMAGLWLQPLRTREANVMVPRFLILATLTIIAVLVVVPLASVFAQAFSTGTRAYWSYLIDDPETRHSIFLSLMVAPLAVAMNTLFGIAAAYTIARFRFPGRTVLTTLIDLPFSVSPVVAGLAFVLLFGLHAPLGAWLKAHGYQVIFAPPGLVLATAFVTVPFVARELIPVLEAQGSDEEVAARSLGANGWQMFWRVTLPNIRWGLIYGVILCNARALGEFGAIYVVSGRVGGKTDTMPLRVEKLFQEYNQPAAFALASLLTLLALVTLVLKVAVEHRLRAEQRQRPAALPERG
jgi:sulfate ABC transporter permease protein CysW/sulfate ABC transporter permease protein CysT